MQVNLDNFEGPIDLLVYLVQKNDMAISEIKISEITEQYLELISGLDPERIENAADFMAMAATLIFLKSKSLLPNEEQDGEDVQAALQIKEELIRKIQEFQTYKEMSKKIIELPWKNRDFFHRPVASPEVIKEMAWAPLDVTEIVNSYQKCLVESRRTMTMIKKEYMSINERVAQITPIISKDPNTEFSSLLSADPSVPEIVITFISLLELARLKFIELTQDGYKSAIKITVVKNLTDLDMSELTGFDAPVKEKKKEDTTQDTTNEQVSTNAPQGSVNDQTA